MARKVGIDDIRQMNEIYYKCKSYAETARQTGWSASTVSKYIDKNFSPVITENIKIFNMATDLPEFSTEIFKDVENFGDLFVLSDEEKIEMAELWKELAI